MKRLFLTLMLAAMANGALVSNSYAGAPIIEIGKAFVEICLNNLPDYTGLDEHLRGSGYNVASNGSYHEFSHPDIVGMWGALNIDGDNSGCSILHEEMSEYVAKRLGEQFAKYHFLTEPTVWKYDGVPSGWLVPYQGRMLYLVYNDGGLSVDIRDK